MAILWAGAAPALLGLLVAGAVFFYMLLTCLCTLCNGSNNHLNLSRLAPGRQLFYHNYFPLLLLMMVIIMIWAIFVWLYFYPPGQWVSWTEFCNSLDNGPPSNPSDAAAETHDKAYSQYLAKGENPYFTFNKADVNFIRDTAGAGDWGGKFGNWVFRVKQHIAPHHKDVTAHHKGAAGSSLASRTGRKRPPPPRHVFINLAKKKKGSGQKRPRPPDDPDEGPSRGGGAMDGGGGEEPMEQGEGRAAPQQVPRGGGGAGGVGVSTGDYINRTEWHWGEGHVTITCYATRLVHLNAPETENYRAVGVHGGDHLPGRHQQDDFHRQMVTPWNHIDCNAWGVWLSPADWQNLVCFCDSVTAVSLEQKVFNVAVKTVHETNISGQPTKVYNNDLTATIMIAEDSNNSLPYTPQAMRCQTLGFLPWRPCNLPTYRYYLPSKSKFPARGTATPQGQMTYGQWVIDDYPFFTVETLCNIDMLRTGDEWQAGHYTFDCDSMPLYVHWQGTRQLGAPPAINLPQTADAAGSVKHDTGNYWGNIDKAHESIMRRPFNATYQFPRWAWVNEAQGQCIHPPPNATRNAFYGLDQTDEDQGNDKYRYDNCHGAPTRANELNNWFQEPERQITGNVQRGNSAVQYQNLNNQLPGPGGIAFGEPSQCMNTFSVYSAADKPVQTYPWGQIWDKRPTTDYKPAFQQAAMVCHSNPPGQILVRVSPNLTNDFIDTTPTNNQARILTYSNFYWQGKLVLKASIRPISQWNIYHFPLLDNTKQYIPDALGDHSMPSMDSRYLPRHMY
ncbi:VP1 [Equine protoparvovirus]|uniref:Capsid protein VP1 n=1 Tax=Equine protoparvovirus TaxID=2860269 RepID=A0AAX1PBU4_9VIRU|nr:VP1 [Equine protoparvovirus]QXQ21752.1 VP1 [Equine protoparvovirus]